MIYCLVRWQRNRYSINLRKNIFSNSKYSYNRYLSSKLAQTIFLNFHSKFA